MSLLKYVTHRNQKRVFHTHVPCPMLSRRPRLPPSRYRFQLALILVVDSENHTQLAMQVLVSHERADDFLFIFEHFKELCRGAHSKVK